MATKKMPLYVLGKVSERYGVTPRELKLLSASESGNVIYHYQAGENEFILKLISHSNKDKESVKNSLEGELGWINYLADNGINTPRVIASKHNNYVELIDLDSNSFSRSYLLRKPEGDK
jgi:Ser/Thr protein kinase RdoA (MazF antagonist)